MVIETNDLGLAAYIKMNGQKLMSINGKVFVFESERELDDWYVEYSNSCCHRHDTELLNLRKMMKRPNRNPSGNS